MVACGSRPDLEAAWVSFLSKWQWDWFVTMTFRGDPPHPERADAQWRFWCSRLSRSIYGANWHRAARRGRGIHWVRATEHQRRGAIHFHALIGANRLDEARRLYWMDQWWKLAGYSRILPPRSAEAVASYCAKYVTKEGQIDCGGCLAGAQPSLRHAAPSSRLIVGPVNGDGQLPGAQVGDPGPRG